MVISWHGGIFCITGPLCRDSLLKGPVMWPFMQEIHWISSTMMTSSNGNIFRITGHLFGEFTGPRWIPTQRPVTQSFDVFFDLRLNKQLSKQSCGWWFETLSLPLWRHCNERAVVQSLHGFLLLTWISFCTNSLVASEIRWHDALVASLK